MKSIRYCALLLFCLISLTMAPPASLAAGLTEQELLDLVAQCGGEMIPAFTIGNDIGLSFKFKSGMSQKTCKENVDIACRGVFPDDQNNPVCSRAARHSCRNGGYLGCAGKKVDPRTVFPRPVKVPQPAAKPAPANNPAPRIQVNPDKVNDWFDRNRPWIALGILTAAVAVTATLLILAIKPDLLLLAAPAVLLLLLGASMLHVPDIEIQTASSDSNWPRKDQVVEFGNNAIAAAVQPLGPNAQLPANLGVLNPNVVNALNVNVGAIQVNAGNVAADTVSTVHSTANTVLSGYNQATSAVVSSGQSAWNWGVNQVSSWF